MSLIIFFIFIFLYFLNIGFFTILERKIFGVLQSRKSVFRVSFLNFYHFFLDFCKAFGKGIYNFEMMPLQFSCLVFFLIYLIVIIFLIGLLFMNSYSFNFYYGIFYYIILDISFIFLKIFLTNTFNFKFSKISSQKMKKIYLFGESVFLISSFLILCFFSLLGISFMQESENILGLNFFKMLSLAFLFFLFLGVIFFILLLKYFRTPFDFLEIETEFVGGVVLELFGIIFTIWMLLEYIFIFNGIIYMLGVLSSFFYYNVFFYIISLSVLSLFLTILVFLSKGVLVRGRFFSIFFVISKIFFLYFILTFFVVLFFFSF